MSIELEYYKYKYRNCFSRYFIYGTILDFNATSAKRRLYRFI